MGANAGYAPTSGLDLSSVDSGAACCLGETVAEVIRVAGDTRAIAGSPAQTWLEWQRDVVAILRRDFSEALHQVSIEEIDWPAWRRFYLEGRSPPAAVDRALERDL